MLEVQKWITEDGRKCARCRNPIWKNGGLAFKTTNGKTIWFCREDCAKLHIDDGGRQLQSPKLMSYEEYMNQRVDKILRKK